MKKIIESITCVTVIIIGPFLFLKKIKSFVATKKKNEMITKIHQFEKVKHRLPNSIAAIKVDTKMGEGS